MTARRKSASAASKQSGEDNAAGGDAVENERVNVIGTEDHGEVGAGAATTGTNPWAEF
jgi:hypothetical protein